MSHSHDLMIPLSSIIIITIIIITASHLSLHLPPVFAACRDMALRATARLHKPLRCKKLAEPEEATCVGHATCLMESRVSQAHGTCIETLAILIINICISLSITLNYIGLQF